MLQLIFVLFILFILQLKTVLSLYVITIKIFLHNELDVILNISYTSSKILLVSQ